MIYSYLKLNKKLLYTSKKMINDVIMMCYNMVINKG